MKTLKNDVELKIGSSGWRAAKEAFEQLMNDPNFRENGEKIIAAGYSIGGGHLEPFLGRFSNKISLAFTFNAPSIAEEIAGSFAEEINAADSREEDPLSIYVIRSIHDPVSKFGSRHIGHGVIPGNGVHVELVEVDFQDSKMGGYDHHTTRAFSSRPCRMKCFSSFEDLTVKLDNSKRGSDVSWYQQLHKKWGWIAFHFVQFLDYLISFIHKLMGTAKHCDALRYKW